MVAKVPEFPDFAFWDLENSTKIQLLMVFLALVGRWPPSSSLKFDARQRWRPNPTLHLMHSTNPPVGPLPPRAASPGLKISTGTRPDPVLPAEAGGAAQRGPCIVWGHFYWSADKWFTWRNVPHSAPHGYGEEQLEANVSHDPENIHWSRWRRK